MRKFSFKHNNKGTVSRKGECSIVRINRLQQFCMATDCKPSQNTKFTSLYSPLLHPVYTFQKQIRSAWMSWHHMTHFLEQQGHDGTHQKAMPPAVTHMSTKTSVILVHHLTSVFWLYWIVRSFVWILTSSLVNMKSRNEKITNCTYSFPIMGLYHGLPGGGSSRKIISVS